MKEFVSLVQREFICILIRVNVLLILLLLSHLVHELQDSLTANLGSLSSPNMQEVLDISRDLGRLLVKEGNGAMAIADDDERSLSADGVNEHAVLLQRSRSCGQIHEHARGVKMREHETEKQEDAKHSHNQQGNEKTCRVHREFATGKQENGREN